MTNDRRYYPVIVNSQLDPAWSDWCDGMLITWCDGFAEAAGQRTVLSRYVADQAALYGLLNKLGDLKLELVSGGRAGGVTAG